MVLLRLTYTNIILRNQWKILAETTKKLSFLICRDGNSICLILFLKLLRSDEGQIYSD